MYEKTRIIGDRRSNREEGIKHQSCSTLLLDSFFWISRDITFYMDSVHSMLGASVFPKWCSLRARRSVTKCNRYSKRTSRIENHLQIVPWMAVIAYQREKFSQFKWGNPALFLLTFFSPPATELKGDAIFEPQSSCPSPPKLIKLLCRVSAQTHNRQHELWSWLDWILENKILR